MARRMTFHSLRRGSSEELTTRLMERGMAVDRTPKVGYTLLVAFGDAGPGVADEVTVGLDGVTVESDEEI